MSKKILVTGINGFVGKHLARELDSRGISVYGIGQRESEVSPEIKANVTSYFQCDVTNSDEVSELPLGDIDGIINLAGLANVGASFDNPELYMDVNVKVLSVLGEALLKANPSARMIAISSGALYDPNQPMPLTENSKTVEKSSPYALSKLAMEGSAQTLRSMGLDCIVVRPFNHIGPGQGPGFLVPDLSKKLKIASEIENPTITVGNIKTIRDYSDVRDIARAYSDLAEAATLSHDLYNVCSGQGVSGEDMIRELCEKMKIDFSKLTINIDPNLVRPSDPQKIVGNHDRLSADTSWKPTLSLSQTISDIAQNI